MSISPLSKPRSNVSKVEPPLGHAYAPGVLGLRCGNPVKDAWTEPLTRAAIKRHRWARLGPSQQTGTREVLGGYARLDAV